MVAINCFASFEIMKLERIQHGGMFSLRLKFEAEKLNFWNIMFVKVVLLSVVEATEWKLLYIS